MALKLYTRYLAREIFGATAVITLAFVGLFAFFDLIAELRDVGRGNYGYLHALAFVSLTLPGRAYDLMPICVLIGALYGLTVLAKHSEITVLRASGLSTAALLISLLQIGMVFVVLTLALGEWVAPPAERTAQQLRLQAIGKMVGREFRTGLWIKDGTAFVNVRDVQPDGSLLQVRIFEFDDRFRLTTARVAAKGNYIDDRAWRLTEVVENRYSDSGSKVERLPEMIWQSGLTPDVVSVLLVAPERMSIGKLVQYVGFLDENRRTTEKYEIALWKKLVYPLACLVMMVLAMPFGFLQDRFGGVSAKVFAGVMLGIGFHMLNGLFSNLGAINNWSPPLAAMAPSLLFLAIATLMVWRQERR